MEVMDTGWLRSNTQYSTKKEDYISDISGRASTNDVLFFLLYIPTVNHTNFELFSFAEFTFKLT